MRAIVLEKFGGLDGLVYKDIPEPEPIPGHVVIQIKAFGLNHAEMHMRRVNGPRQHRSAASSASASSNLVRAASFRSAPRWRH